ncbi:MAG: endonuclease [Ignavibacteriales bacterium]|nr:endonuclease [Ignavibacteriales bacterium]
MHYPSSTGVKKTIILLCVVAVWSTARCWQQKTAADYYAGAYKTYGVTLRAALHNIIKGHTSVTYSGLYTYFPSTDTKSNGKVWDVYSDIPGGIPAYEYSHGVKQCGTYGGEGDCYNREHSWPSSWFNDQTPSYTDMFHLYPTDGYVNNRRSNYPYGTVASATWTSTNGSKVGTCSFPGYSGTVFEPITAYKGDLARSQMYMSVRYYTEDGGWSTSPATNKSDLLPWYSNLLYDWSIRDTVSQKEIDRNNAVYGIQHNRNPFIDHPEFAAEIWKTDMPPSVVSVVQANTASLIIDFSRYLDSTAAAMKTNFVLDGNIGNPTGIQWGVNNDVSKLLLTTSSLAAGTTYTIQIKNLKSINGVAMSDTVVAFKTAGTTAVDESDKILPASTALGQNYPNPFNPTTEIRFTLQGSGFTSLKVFDVLGREVATLVNEYQQAGEHQVQFDIHSMRGTVSSGVYVYRLAAGNTNIAKHLMILK